VLIRHLSAIAVVLVAMACAKGPPEFEEVPPADELFAEGQQILEGTRYLGLIHRVDYDEAIETFQTIIDNYPYSEYAVAAELAIADAYFDDKKYEEANTRRCPTRSTAPRSVTSGGSTPPTGTRRRPARR
jgi:outer membrane protein assembly factor BamD (BamD/ComL family)